MTTPVLSPETDFVLLAEEIADDLKCEADTGTCPERATWSIRCEGCVIVALVCTRHKEQVSAWAVANASVGVVCLAPGCRYQYPIPLPFLPL